MKSNHKAFSIRKAEQTDVSLILHFIKKLVRLAALATERNCGRLEWAVLDWNEPSIEFYKSRGARMMNEWIVNRMSGESLVKLAAKF